MAAPPLVSAFLANCPSADKAGPFVGVAVLIGQGAAAPSIDEGDGGYGGALVSGVTRNGVGDYSATLIPAFNGLSTNPVGVAVFTQIAANGATPNPVSWDVVTDSVAVNRLTNVASVAVRVYDNAGDPADLPDGSALSVLVYSAEGVA